MTAAETHITKIFILKFFILETSTKLEGRILSGILWDQLHKQTVLSLRRNPESSEQSTR